MLAGQSGNQASRGRNLQPPTTRRPAVTLRGLPMAALFVLLLAACAPRAVAPPAPTAAMPPAAALPPAAQDGAAAGRYVGGPVALECAPFARALSGIDLRGAAADWWRQANGRYAQSSQPAVGAVLVFRRTDRLADGHAAVVSHVISARTILVTQANWVARRVTEDMPVMDVSAANDWSAVRVWWPPAGQMGSRHYPTWGFILPDRPVSRDRLEASTREVLRVTLAE